MKNLMMITAFTIVFMLAGCSKGSSDDGGSDNKEKERMENQHLMNSIRQHIVGTWVHDGDCIKVYDIKTPYNEIILKDDLLFEESSEKDTFAFSDEGSVKLYRVIGEGMNFDGKWRITSGTINMDNDDLLPPYGISMIYNDISGYSQSRAKFYRIFFSGDFKQLFLYDNSRYEVLRYNKQ